MEGLENDFILWAEDDQDDFQIFSEQFSQYFHGVVLQATSGTQALEKLHLLCQKKLIPKLIITDIHLPRLGGKDFIQAIHSDCRYDDVPIAILTTNTEKDYLNTMPSVHVFKKPHLYQDITELAQRIMSLI